MVAMNIRNLDPKVHRGLRDRAARRGVSMEEEVRRILTRAASPSEPGNLADLFLSTFGARHGIALEIPDRKGREASRRSMAAGSRIPNAHLTQRHGNAAKTDENHGRSR